MFSDEEKIPISALQHFVFCPRQCALIHIEQLWTENILTAEGRLMHERVHQETIQTRKKLRIERNVPLWSDRLGLTGRSDVLEISTNSKTGHKTVIPVEYKHGPKREKLHDDIQLAALETPTKVIILTGGLYPDSSVISAAQGKNVPLMVVADDTMTVVTKMDSAVRKVSVRGKRIEESISTFRKFVDKKYLEMMSYMPEEEPFHKKFEFI